MGKQIRRAKAFAWAALIKDLEEDPWRKAYKIDTGKCAKGNLLSKKNTDYAVTKLFPMNDEIIWMAPEPKICNKFTVDELEIATFKLRTGKADGVPAEVTRLVVAVAPVRTFKVLNYLFKKRVVHQA